MMGAKAAVAVSKGRGRRALAWLCIFTSQIIALTILANCGDGDVVMAMRQALAGG